MIWNNQSRNTVFILGAGATRGAFPHVRINGKKIQAPLNKDFFGIAENFAKAKAGSAGLAARYTRLRRVFKDEFPTRGRWPLPMEEAFSLLFVSKDFPEIFRARRGRRRVAGTRKEIEDFLRLTFGLLSSIETQVPEQTLYSVLVKSLEPGDTIISLNYDTLLDSALVRSGWNPQNYRLMGDKRKIQWKTGKPQSNPRLSEVALLKLHGSINWYVKGNYGKLSRVFDAKPTRILISSKPRINETSGFIRQIVPPIYGKFFGHKHWRTLWSEGHRSLTSAEVLVVIGCSLVDTDFHLIGMLGNAVQARKKKNRKFSRIILVDRKRVRNKWKRALKGSFASYSAFPRFSEFAKKIAKRMGA